MLSKLFGQRAPTRQRTPRPEASGGSIAGNIYAFHTMPTNEFSAPATGRWAVFKVLGTNERMVVVAVLDGVWTSLPSLNDAIRASILREHRFAWTGRQAVFGVNIDWWSSSELSEQVLLGSSAVLSLEAALATQVMSFAPGSRMSTLQAANHAAEGEWRWKHDREAFAEEVERKKLRIAEQRAAQEDRYRTRLSKLSWDQCWQRRHSKDGHHRRPSRLRHSPWRPAKLSTRRAGSLRRSVRNRGSQMPERF